MDALASALLGHVAVEEPEESGLRWAAVALVLRGVTTDDAELLFIRRAEREGDPWSGHIAFPGGRRDDADRSLEATARRETGEELALDLDASARLLGALDDIRPRSAALPSIAVRPYVFILEREVPLVPNVEVQSAFWMSLAALRDPSRAAEHTSERGGVLMRFPAYRCGDDLVWGLTERIVTQLLAVSASVR